MLRQVSQLLTRLVPDRPVFTSLVSQTVSQQLGGVRTNALQILAFALAGLLLAVIGVYGVLSFDVSRRTREIGIRMALGAKRGQVLGLVLREGGRLAAAGVALGVLASAGVARLLDALLYGVSGIDPVAYASAVAILLLVAGIANMIPAWSAARVNPAKALRGE
jgi:putative ABC transport system permease protein